MQNYYSTLLGILVISPALAVSQQYNQENQPENNCNCINPGLVNPDKVLAKDTTFCYAWPFQAVAWSQQFITINNYDEEGRVYEAILKNADVSSGQYIPARKYSYEYENDGSLKMDQLQVWNPTMNGGSWSNITKAQFDYDAEGKLLLATTWFSAYDESEWRDGTKEYYGYNADGLNDTTIVKYWNTIQNDWYFSYRYRYIYDNNQEVVEKYSDWANNLTGTYVLNTRTVFVRNFVTNTIDEIEQDWNQNEWVNDDHRFHQLNEDGQPASILYQNWYPTNNMWDTVVMSRELFEYNANGKITQYTMQSYYIIWENMERTITNYYESGEIRQTLVLDWNGYYQEWENEEKCEFPAPQYVPTGFDAAFQTEAGISVSPNPANGLATIKSDIKFSEIEVMNLAGRKVLNVQANDNQASFSTDLLSDGIYIVKINYPVKAIMKKLIIKH